MTVINGVVYNPKKLSYKWVTGVIGVITPISGVMGPYLVLLITGRGPLCSEYMSCMTCTILYIWELYYPLLRWMIFLA